MQLTAKHYAIFGVAVCASLLALFGAYAVVHSSIVLILLISPGYLFAAVLQIDNELLVFVVSALVNYLYYYTVFWLITILVKRKEGETH